MLIDRVFCLFEQSGTFKDAFKSFGITAFNYDLCNDFGKTDFIIDLFSEIEKAFSGTSSIFDNIHYNDLVFAFFPCTRFEARVPLLSRCQCPQYSSWNDIDKLLYSIDINAEINKLYTLICKLFIVCLRKGFKMIVENPYTQPHYLTNYFPVLPSIIDRDRTLNGDYFKKPTQYWFVNCKDQENVIFEPLEYLGYFTVTDANKMGGNYSRSVKRSLISSQYAKRFIMQHVLNSEVQSV